jgi:HPt (histidine-containing phosphotransfer) domain-containing protein
MSDFPDNTDGKKCEYDMQPESEIANKTSFDDLDLSVMLGFAEMQSEDEPDLIVELIDLYLADFPQQLSVMKDSVSRADEISLKRAAHTLKGSSANLGINGIAAICQLIEETDSSQSLQQSSDFINRMEETFARVRLIFLAERQRRI